MEIRREGDMDRLGTAEFSFKYGKIIATMNNPAST